MKTVFTLLLLIFFINVKAQNQLAIPPTLSGNDLFLNLQTGTTPFFSGSLTNTMGVNGNLLGPTIILEQGQNVNMHVTNNLGEPTTIHWHGLHVSPENDGGPHIVISPNQTWEPSWVVLDQASTNWYHPHLHHMTNVHVQKGISGMIIVKDPNEASKSLPRTYGLDDFPIVVQSKAFDSNNQVIVESALDVNVMVNGTLEPYLDAPAQMVRLRLLNGSSERYYNFGFSNNMNFQMIATEGGLLENPLSMSRLMLAPGERAEIIVDLSLLLDQTIFLKSYGAELPNGIYGAAQPGMGAGQTIPNYANNPLNGNNFDVLKINVIASTPSPIQQISTNLNVLNPWDVNQANSNRTLTFQSSVQGPSAINGPFTINGNFFDMDVINYQIPFNNIEIWTLTNQSPISHPFHIHGVSFYILDINGNPPPAYLRGRKDVVHVPAGQGTVRFITKFENFASLEHPYMYHCHMLTHEDDGMMGQYLIMPPCDVSISNQPSDISVNVGENAIFQVNTQPINQTFQWQTDMGFGFVNLSNAGQYTGVNTSTLTVSNTSLTNDNQLFRCLVGSGFCADTTQTVQLSVINGTNLVNLNSLNSITLFPNPTSYTLELKGLNHDIDIQLFDVYGNLILCKSILKNKPEIQVSDLKSGVYFIQSNSMKETLRFVKK
jgi:FtsP/CotA-like multicopper oxidase with cupredoxin domain